VRFALLGPLSVHDQSGEISVAGRLRRTLLAALLLDAGTPVSTDRLAALLWGAEAAGSSAPAALHVQVMRLRHALGDQDQERVRAVPPGYLIQLAPGELDLHVFAEEYAAGRRKLGEQAWADAAKRFRAALELWRGRPLAGIPALAHDVRVRELEETYVLALQGRIEAELNLGRHRDLADELGALVQENPRNETFHRQLMLALHRAGRSDEAVGAYDAYESSLLDELGLEPSAELAELREAVVRDDASLALRLNPDAPRQLPADTRLFTGRAAETAELVAAAEKSPGTLVISALDGLGGIGKTTLAVHAAHHLADRFPDGQLFIDLRGRSAGTEPVSPGDALAYLLRSLGVPPRAVPDDVPERSALYRSKLADSRTLIVLDNAVNPEQVRPLLPAAPGCLVLITSRNRMTGLEHAEAMTVDVLSEPESLALLAVVAGPRRALTDSPAARELAALCGHLPLALRIVAARLRHQDTLTVEGLVAELGDEDRRLGGLSDGERDLRSVFDSSLAALPAPERDLLVLLGQITGPDVDVYGAASLAGLDLATARRLLDALVEHNLLIRQAERYGLHDLVRSYARTLMDRTGVRARAARERLLDFYQHTAWIGALQQPAGIRWRALAFPEPSGPVPELPDVSGSLSWFRAERANLLATVSDAGTPPERRIDLTSALAGYLLQDGPWSQTAQMHEAAARIAEELDEPLALAAALCNLSQILRQIGRSRFGEAVESAERALRICRELGHRRGETDALYRIGQISYNQGRPEDTVATHMLALPIAQETGDRYAEAQIRLALGQSCDLLGKREESRMHHDISVRILRELGLPHMEALALSSSTRKLISEGEFAVAAENCRRGLAIGREYGHRQVEASFLTNLGWILGMTGRHEQAHAEFRNALGIFEELGYETGVTMVLAFLGPSRTNAGDPVSAIGYLERGYSDTDVAAEGAHLYTQVELMRELGYARYLTGDPRGVPLLERALETYRGPLDDDQGMGATLNRLGAVALDQSETEIAIERFEEALRLTRVAGMPIDQAHALDGLARCRERLGDPDGARESLREAAELYRRMGAFELADAERRLTALDG
jgi:DNA-binding SARP family transcriptional activator/Flp pilus assembly protein TadD